MRASHLGRTMLARIRLLYGRRTPLRIAHFITTRCNLKCTFCGCHDMPVEKELHRQEIKEAMRTFKSMGTLAWGFTGGEPFVRSDLPELLHFAKKLGLLTSVVTNGTLLDRIKEVSPEHVDFLMVSFEGLEERTKEIRGDRCSKLVLETVDYLCSNKFKTCISATFDENSRDDIIYTIEYARSRELCCSFQPVFDFSTQREVDRYRDDHDSLRRLRENIDFLIERKKRGDPIWNSLPYLEWARNYGETNRFYCYAGKLYATMMPDGSLRRCMKIAGPARSGDYQRDFDQLVLEPRNCYCYPWCHIEYSLNFSLNPRTLINTLRRLF